jgi:hypothetical protein
MSDPDPVCFVVVLLPSAQSTGQLFLLKELLSELADHDRTLAAMV